MAGGLILVCKHGSRSAGVMVTRGMDFVELVNKICRRWSDLDPDTILLNYSLSGDESLTLGDSEDLSSLVDIAEAGGFDDIEVVIKDAIVELAGSYGGIPSQTTQNVVHENALDHDDIVSPSFCTHEKRSLKSTGWADGISAVGQKFEGGVVHFRNVLRKYAIEKGFEYVLVKNDKVRVTAQCKHKDTSNECPWEVHGRVFKVNGSFVIRKFVSEHNCRAMLKTTTNPRATSELIGSLIVDDVRAEYKKKPMDVVTDMKKDYGLDISYHQAWWAVERANGEVYGDYELSFSSLRWWAEAATSTNPGSRIVFDVDEETKRFKRLFVAFGACIDGFSHCRPILFLDATFLKARNGGQLLGATGKSGNQEIFPLCYAVVDSENNENWLWFLQQMKCILGPEREYTFISDRNLGLLGAMKIVFPNSPHGYCLFHLKYNLRHHMRGAPAGFTESLVHLFTMCAYAPTVELFGKYIYILSSKGGQKVMDFLLNLPPQHWSNAHFPGCRYGEMFSNVAESFNSWIKKERELPVRNLVDAIRVKIMKQIVERRGIANTWVTRICPDMEKMLNVNFNVSRPWVVSESGYGIYEVHSHPTVSVNLIRRLCDCRKWQQDGFPCSHAVGAINRAGQDIVSFIDRYYYVETYCKSYSYSISPIPTVWMPQITADEDMIKPPLSKKPPGRPKKKRIPSRGENVGRIRCGRCRKMGNHNRSSCRAAM